MRCSRWGSSSDELLEGVARLDRGVADASLRVGESADRSSLRSRWSRLSDAEVAVGAQAVDDLVGIDVEVRRQLGRVRRPAQALVQHLRRGPHLVAQLLQPPRDTDRPRRVAVVAAQLTAGGDGGERLELDPERRVEPLRRLDEGEAGDLDQIVERLAPRAVAPGDGDRQPAVVVDDAVAQRTVARCSIDGEHVLGRRARRRCWWAWGSARRPRTPHRGCVDRNVHQRVTRQAARRGRRSRPAHVTRVRDRRRRRARGAPSAGACASPAGESTT